MASRCPCPLNPWCAHAHTPWCARAPTTSSPSAFRLDNCVRTKEPMCHCSPTSPHILLISGATVSPPHALPAPVHPYTSIMVPPSACPVTCPREGGVALGASTCLDRGARRSHYLQLSIFHLVSFSRFHRDSLKKRFDKDMLVATREAARRAVPNIT